MQSNLKPLRRKSCHWSDWHVNAPRLTHGAQLKVVLRITKIINICKEGSPLAQFIHIINVHIFEYDVIMRL